MLARLDAAWIANARANVVREVRQHPQLLARGRWTPVATPAGGVPAYLPPVDFDTVTPRMEVVPALGQHTHAIHQELGWDESTVAQLQVLGVI